jgi:hypothetical protein
MLMKTTALSFKLLMINCRLRDGAQGDYIRLLILSAMSKSNGGFLRALMKD